MGDWVDWEVLVQLLDVYVSATVIPISYVFILNFQGLYPNGNFSVIRLEIWYLSLVGPYIYI